MRFRALSAFTLLAGSCLAASAGVVPYPDLGTIPPSVPLTATATGSVTGYFYGSDAGGTDYVRLLDVTSGHASLFLLSNHATTPGAAVDFGSVQFGDTLVFELVNSDVETNKDGTDYSNTAPFYPNAQANSYIMASDPVYSVDQTNHAYVTTFPGDVALGIPSGIFLGMEDLPFGANDKDYNDTEFVFTNISQAAVTPEPDTLLLFGTGLMGTIGIARRRE